MLPFPMYEIQKDFKQL